MVNLITQKITSQPIVNTYQTQVKHVEQLPQVQSAPVEKDVKTNNKKHILIPASLFIAGGTMLYFGLKKPSPEKFYDRYAKGKLFEMDKKMRAYTSFVKDTLNSAFEGVTEFIQNFKNTRFIEPSEDLGPLRVLKDPRKLLSAQDIAFEAIESTDRAEQKLGAPIFGEFSSFVTNVKKGANSAIERQQRIVNLELGDYVCVPGLKNEKHSDLVEATENRLIEMKNFFSGQTVRIANEQISLVSKRKYREMAEAILESRRRIRQSKANIVETTYASMRRIFGVKDLKPTYSIIPEAKDFELLTPEQLKPTKTLPKKLRDASKYNVYLKAIRTKDFANLTDDDLKEIFYSTGYSNDLQDLGFLIDKLRLKQFVDQSRNATHTSAYDVIIPKLEYLSKQLHEFGKRELLDLVSADFGKMQVENKRSSVYYIMRVARRLGIDSIQDVDAILLKENAAYADMSIRKYISIFRDNPDLYFC